MQHVTAFFRPQAVPAVPSARPKKNLWILSSWRDLIPYVATPLLILISQAIVQFYDALRLRPDDPATAQNLRLAQSQSALF